MARPERIESLSDVKTWIAEHDGRNDAYWESQHSRNDKVDERFLKVESRLSAVEKRIMQLAGAAAAVGATVGALLGTLIAKSITGG